MLSLNDRIVHINEINIHSNVKGEIQFEIELCKNCC